MAGNCLLDYVNLQSWIEGPGWVFTVCKKNDMVLRTTTINSTLHLKCLGCQSLKNSKQG